MCKGATQAFHATFESVIKHVRHHGHAALHPLSSAAKFGMIELGHGAVSIDESLQHAHDRLCADLILLG